jgi:hypothetical protein
MANVLFKFCSGAGAISILKGNSIFITSPLDLNDPFEMRPGWTDEHQKRHFQDEQLRSQMAVGMPLHIATGDGLKPVGTMPYFPPQQLGPVESHRGISDQHNSLVFGFLHSKFRILSLVDDLFDIANGEGESDVQATLMWSHYADQFQGVCLALDTTQFDNGISEGGFQVKYPPERQNLPPSYYDCWQSLSQVNNESAHQLDAASGLLLTTAQRAERERQHFLNLLTHKSPGWEYEHEIRMIYDLPNFLASENYRKKEFVCEVCLQKKLPVEQCSHAFYRDGVYLPTEAIRAVIFGTDSSMETVQQIFEILSMAQYSHVECYWSCLHSDKYNVQYVKGKHDYIKFMQEDRAEKIAYAKEHLYHDGTSLRWRPARKGINYLPQKPKKP